LGFQLETTQRGALLLHLPDLVVLNARWEKLREKNPHLDALNTHYSTQDNISHEEFIRLLTEGPNFNYAVVSKRKEFVHDMVAHVFGLIVRLIQAAELGPDAYKKAVENLSETVKPYVAKIKAVEEKVQKGELTKEWEHEIEIAKMSLSAFVDYETAQLDFTHFLKIDDTILRTFLKIIPSEDKDYGTTLQPYVDALFPNEKIDMAQIWTKIEVTAH
jgi:hypothetical protein